MEKCFNCANRDICIHYRTMQRMYGEMQGLVSLADAGITVELVVKECPYFREAEERRPAGYSLREMALRVVDAIKEVQKGVSAAPRDEVLKKLAEKGMQSEDAEKIIRALLREGTIYEPRPGYLKIT